MTDPIVIEAFVEASPVQAWGAFTTPTDIVQWNYAVPEWHCPSAKVELRIGGRHMARMEARDGTVGFDFEGTYEEVDAPHAITLRLDDGRGSRTVFVAEEHGTRVTTTFDPEASNPVEMQRAGWQAILDNFASYAARSRAPN